jgi:hypothetical protein
MFFCFDAMILPARWHPAGSTACRASLEIRRKAAEFLTDAVLRAGIHFHSRPV